MLVTITKTEQPGALTILHLDGILDGSNHQSLIDEAKKQSAAGVRDLILDLGNLIFISSAGLSALHQVALMFKGNKHLAEDESWAAYRWAAYRAIDSDHDKRLQQHVKLLSPTRQVREVLDLIGFNSLFEIYTDLHDAVSSFDLAAPVMESNLR
jgi:anti-anti-sigma factor